MSADPKPIGALMGSSGGVSDLALRLRAHLERVGQPHDLAPDDDPRVQGSRAWLEDPDRPGSRPWNIARALAHEERCIDPNFAEATTDLPAVRAWVQQFVAGPVGARSLFLAGPCNSGKTHAAWAALRMVTRSGVGVLWSAIAAADWAAVHRPPCPDPEWIFRLAAEAPLLFIDDLGADHSSEAKETLWYRLINYRYNKRLPLIATTNLNAEAFGAALGERTRSRLREMTGGPDGFQVEVSGYDWRRGQAA